MKKQQNIAAGCLRGGILLNGPAAWRLDHSSPASGDLDRCVMTPPVRYDDLRRLITCQALQRMRHAGLFVKRRDNDRNVQCIYSSFGRLPDRPRVSSCSLFEPIVEGG
jgi:hypothetical protein